MNQNISNLSELLSAIAIIFLIFSPIVLVLALRVINILLEKLNRRLDDNGYKNK